jgi:alpha-L-arabinofuranosidase
MINKAYLSKTFVARPGHIHPCLCGFLLFWFSCFLPDDVRGAGLLLNPSFDSQPVLDKWELHVYGANPEIHQDTSQPHGGSCSVCIEANSPSDTALGQEVTLEPNEYYRLSGWVRTEGLKPESASVYGTLQVQQAQGKGTIASGANHQGDTDWTEVPVLFRTPANGRVRICVFFAGFGTGTGRAWFDDLTVEPIQVDSCPFVVTREPASKETISPLQYGQFIEYLCNLVPAMWAEKLYDGSFEGLSPYKFQFIKETDFRERPWYPSGQVNRAEYSLDPSTKVSGQVSKRIIVAEGAPCRAGLSQDGVCVDRGRDCDFTCWFRAEGLGASVRARLHQGPRLLAESEFKPSNTWEKYRTRFHPKAQVHNATMTIDFAGPGTLWLDNASLMPVNTVGGWRPDVVAAVRALKPGIIRFGGSALDDPNLGDFEWRDTIGDPDRRRPFRAWGGLQPVGPGLEEIVQFCRAVEAEPLICVRTRERTPKDAAEQVEYFNGSTDTPMGAWRAGNGHREPYRIRYWQIGNEQGGSDYEKRLPEFCRAMKAADPTIKLMSSFPTPGVIDGSRELLDFVCPHHYSHDLAWMNGDLDQIQQFLNKRAPGSQIKIGVTEWNTTAGDAGPRRAMLWTLANALACSRYHNLLHRHCDAVKIANRSNLINSFCSGILQTDTSRLYKTPTYYAQQLYATLAGTRPLRIVSEVPANLGPDLSATLSDSGKEVTLFCVNDSLKRADRMLDFSAFGSRPRSGSSWVLRDSQTAGEPDVTNSFEDPERVRVFHAQVSLLSSRFTYSFPALSLTVLRLTFSSR